MLFLTRVYTMISQQQQTGFDIELKAQYYLQRQGLIYLSKHYACRFGEIDLIMKDQQCLVFVEVRSRNNPNFGSAIDSINPTKQKKLIKTALHYLQYHHLLDHQDARIDVIGQNYDQQIHWIKNALSVQY